MSNKTKQISPLLKWTIILYSMGITAIGYKTLERKNGSIFNYIKKQTVVHANESNPRASSPKSNFLAPRPMRVTPRGKVDRSHSGEHKDDLSNNDRKALNSLIDGL